MRFREPLLLPCVAACIGIAVAQLAAFGPAEAAIAASLLTLVAIIASQTSSSRYLTLSGSLCALFFAGCFCVAVRPRLSPPALSVPDNVPAIFEGCVVDPGLLGADRERFTVELAPRARAQVSLFSKGTYPDLPYGAHIEFRGKVRRPHNYNDPGTFDAVHYLAHQQIYWNASGDASTVRILPGRCGNALSAFIFSIRTAALNRLDHLYANDAYANGMMQAVLIGATAKLDRMWTEDYRSTGTFHALVISGSHVAVLAAVLLFLLRICAVPRGVAIFLTIVTAWLYAGITGWQAPVLRSAAGMTLYGIGRIFFREGRLLNFLAAVALFFVIADPDQLFDASFQLSFLAVALIGAFVAPALNATSSPLARGLTDIEDAAKDLRLEPKTAQFRIELRLLIRTLRMVPRIPELVARIVVVGTARCCLFLWEIFVTSFFIQIGLALPMIVYFHRMSFSGLSANAIVVPVLGAIVPLGFIAIASNSTLLAHVCAWLLALSRAAVTLHARWEPDWRIPAPPLWLAALFVFSLVIAAWRSDKRWTKATGWVALVLSFAAIVLHPFAPVIQHGKLELTAIDVGQGDSLLLGFPQGSLMLIDAGGIPSFGRTRKPGIDIGEDVVSPYLWSRSIRHLDVVAMTHAHEDHMGGMCAVMRNFHPRELWVGATGDSPEWKTIRETAERLHITVRHMQRGDTFAYAGTIMQVLAPGPDYLADITPKNDDSLVMRVRFGSTSFLLTGDMEKRIENELADARLLQHDDVLKVGHHGSRTSSTPTLLDLEKPAFGVVSVGFDNTYGHPYQAIIDALNQRHVAVYRTDERGFVTITSDGRRLQLTTAAP